MLSISGQMTNQPPTLVLADRARNSIPYFDQPSTRERLPGVVIMPPDTTQHVEMTLLARDSGWPPPLATALGRLVPRESLPRPRTIHRLHVTLHFKGRRKYRHDFDDLENLS